MIGQGIQPKFGSEAEAMENLRAYICFLEEMDAKYLPDEPLVAHRERRVHRTIDAAFSDGVESTPEGG